jgi:hypothetical protein
MLGVWEGLLEEVEEQIGLSEQQVEVSEVLGQE